MDPGVVEVRELVLAAPPRAGASRVIAVDGRSGAGKTTFARALRAAFDPHPPLVPLELMYPGWDGLADGVARLVEWVLRPLAAGEPAGYRRFDWESGRYRRERMRVPAAPVVVVEGVGAGAPACAPYLSVLVWLEAPESVRFERAMLRDGDTYRPHWRRWAAQEDAYLRAGDPRSRADVVVGSQAAPSDLPSNRAYHPRS